MRDEGTEENFSKATCRMLIAFGKLRVSKQVKKGRQKRPKRHHEIEATDATEETEGIRAMKVTLKNIIVV